MPATPSADAIAAVADEIAHHPIGDGYYATAVSTDEAREIAEVALAFLVTRPDLLATLTPAPADNVPATAWTTHPVLATVTAP